MRPGIPFLHVPKCPTCAGTGFEVVDRETINCRTCGGSGIAPKVEKQGVAIEEIENATEFVEIIREHIETGSDSCGSWLVIDEMKLVEAITARDTAVREAALAWPSDDTSLPEDDAIKAAHPTRTGDHETYVEAMRLVGAKRSKGALVALVNWLLTSLKKGQP